MEIDRPGSFQPAPLPRRMFHHRGTTHVPMELTALGKAIYGTRAEPRVDWSDEDLNDFRAASLRCLDAEEPEDDRSLAMWCVGAEETKVRPAVVIASAADLGDCPGAVVGILTTKLPRTPGTTHYILQDWRSAGLRAQVLLTSVRLDRPSLGIV
jgi:hypothetical protein